ncbi:EH signature domain-containing protein [Avibacterium paragallinarum]|uniref:EH signature domain-containing protein n=1 Tax=Avibacterium paragallinarum TaxID=728 RepID=A0ABU7QSV4_AVIPA|nr:EH signature domain-containing protein [Avibacterium paragallinarum]
MSSFLKFKKYPSPKFLESIKEITLALERSTEVQSGEVYKRVKSELIEFILNSNHKFRFDTLREISLVLKILAESFNDKVTFLDALWNSNKWIHFFDSILLNVDKDSINIICKRIITLYYVRFMFFNGKSTLDGKDEKEKINCFFTLIDDLLRRYKGNDRLILSYRKFSSLIYTKDIEKLNIFRGNFNIDEIKKEFNWKSHFEILKFIRIIRLLGKIDKWKANEGGKHVTEVLDDIVENKSINIGMERNLLEEAVRRLLIKCIEVNEISPFLENFIILEVGDPRNSRYSLTWRRIGQEYQEWLRARLSRGDLREFLENLTSAYGDEVFQYRKDFWLQYIDYIDNVKIMLGKDDLSKLKRDNYEFYKRFLNQTETYGHLSENKRSCIYMKIRNIHIIEGTFNAKVRVYWEEPINLSSSIYNYKDFHTGIAKRLFIHEQIHNSSETYSWQSSMMSVIRDLTGIEPF